jgi:hypothetical protein
MALTSYTTAAAVKARLDITDSTDDTIITSVIDSVSRLIDAHTGRYFGVDAFASTRYYTAQDTDRLYVDDISTTTGLLVYTDEDGDGTFENTWAATDYRVGPYNAAAAEWPYQFLEVTQNGSFSWPRNDNYAVKIIAKFGWAAVPSTIENACILQTERIFKRFDSPLGVTSTTALGVQTLRVPELDGDVRYMLSPYVRLV